MKTKAYVETLKGVFSRIYLPSLLLIWRQGLNVVTKKSSSCSMNGSEGGTSLVEASLYIHKTSLKILSLFGTNFHVLPNRQQALTTFKTMLIM